MFRSMSFLRLYVIVKYGVHSSKATAADIAIMIHLQQSYNEQNLK